MAGELGNIICAKDYIFVTYDDESVTRARSGEIEFNALAVFSRDQIFRAGLVDLLKAPREKSGIIEINAAYTFDNTIVFVPNLDDTVRILDAERKILIRHAVSFNTVNTVALSGNDKQALAIIGYKELFCWSISTWRQGKVKKEISGRWRKNSMPPVSNPAPGTSGQGWAAG